MKVEAGYPLLFKARPQRATRDKDIFISTKGTHDIPELTLAEMPVVFESRVAFAGRKGSPRPNRHQVRLFGGELYRPICGDFDEAAAGMLFQRAFPERKTETSSPAFKANISIISSSNDEWWAGVSPLSSPLYEQLLWRLSCEQIEKRRLNDLWPSFGSMRDNLGAYPQRINETYARDMMSFEDVRRDLRQIDEAQLSYCHSAFQRHMERFVVADGQLWQRSRGLVYKVQLNRTDNTADVAMVHAPDWQDTNINVRYFDLNDRDAAFECAEQLAQELRTLYKPDKNSQTAIRDLTVSFELDDTAPSFRSGEDELFRLSCAVAAENRRFLVRNPSHADRLAPERVAAVWRAFEEVRKTDYVFREFGDPIDDLRANFDVWLFLGRHQSTYTFEESAFSNLASRRATVLEDARSISLSPLLASHPKPGH